MMSYVRYGIVLAFTLALCACGQKGARLQKSVVPPDKTLFETGQEYLGKSQFIKARLAFQTLINTYPDSDLTAESYMSIGDSFYDEGGTESLIQAEDQYKNFIVFFPTHPKAPDAQMKVIALNMKLMRAPDRDQTYALRAQDAAKRMIQQFPDSPYADVARQQLREIQENLAKGDHMVGDYYHERGNFRASKNRFAFIGERYPEYSEMDDVYLKRAQSLEKTENPDEAAIYYGRIVQGYPFSRHAEEAQTRLQALGKPIPSVDATLAAANQARLKHPEGFSLFRPVIAFTEALGFKGPPDPYENARRIVAERAQAAAAQAGAEGVAGGKPGDDILLTATLKKDASGKTQDESVLGNAPSSEAAAKSTAAKDAAKKDAAKKNNGKKKGTQ